MMTSNDDEDFFEGLTPEDLWSKEEIDRIKDLVRLGDSISVDEMVYELNQLSGVQARKIRWYEFIFYRIYTFFYDFIKKS